MTGMKMRASRCAMLLALAAVACDSGAKAPKASLAQASADSIHKAAGVRVGEPTLGPEAKAALDSGNTLFRKKAYAPALTQYRLASTLSPGHVAPYFGINMVAQATGNKALGDSAMSAIRERAAVPSTLQHPSIDSARKQSATGLRKGPVS